VVEVSRQRLIALLCALAAAIGLAVLAPMASTASAATCASAWSSSQIYTGGMSASYNGHNWSAKWWTQGETPGAADVWADQGACGGSSGGGSGGTTAGSGGSCTYPAWAAGHNYVTGDIVRYTNGNLYIATHDNPGYDPTISTWYWSPYTCSGGSTPPPGGGSGFVVSEAQFNQMFPSRNSFYTDSGLTAAMSAYPGFANTGSDTVKKQEAAAFLANVGHETGRLVYIVEQNTANYSHYCDASQPYGCPAGRPRGQQPVLLTARHRPSPVCPAPRGRGTSAVRVRL
jgi:chitodextrinase